MIKIGRCVDAGPLLVTFRHPPPTASAPTETEGAKAAAATAAVGPAVAIVGSHAHALACVDLRSGRWAAGPIQSGEGVGRERDVGLALLRLWL